MYLRDHLTRLNPIDGNHFYEKNMICIQNICTMYAYTKYKYSNSAWGITKIKLLRLTEWFLVNEKKSISEFWKEVT